MRAFDFYVVDSRMNPQQFLKRVAYAVFGNYKTDEECPGSRDFDEFGLLAMPFGKMLIVKLDIGAWQHYTEYSAGIAAAIAEALDCRLWACGYAIERELSWVDYYSPRRLWGPAVKTNPVVHHEATSGPQVTVLAYETYGISVRDAAAELKKRAIWETKRRWMLADREHRGSKAFWSFMAGNMLLSGNEQALMDEAWEADWPGRKPKDGPLHEQLWFTPTKATAKIIASRPKPEVVFQKEGRTVIESVLNSETGEFETERHETGRFDDPANKPPELPAEMQPPALAEEAKQTKRRVRRFLDGIKSRRRR